MVRMQTKTRSFIESVTNVGVGYVLAILTQLVLFPIFHIQIRLAENFKIAAVFTGISVIRHYCIRRIFNKGRGG
jgi:ABC-type long-subunit fatty acid transport system fused permease/ATPase subunit